MSESYVKIGTLLKPMGTHGEIKADLAEEFLDDLLKMEHVFIKEDGSYIPYFMESIRETNHLLIKFEDVEGPEAALSFNQKDIFLKKNTVTSQVYANKLEKESLIGYSVFDTDVKIGIITNIEQFPQQIMASVDYRGKTVYIPLVDQLIKKIDDNNAVIHMELPAGILDM
ncbi:MAG: 16S rRNA processing protein RimM [Saprospiraceae bacterium]|nr:16S rRNA processing protein RimM [Saprospiraceae bacterium]